MTDHGDVDRLALDHPHRVLGGLGHPGQPKPGLRLEQTAESGAQPRMVFNDEDAERRGRRRPARLVRDQVSDQVWTDGHAHGWKAPSVGLVGVHSVAQARCRIVSGALLHLGARPPK